jgi:hypothetical protein
VRLILALICGARRARDDQHKRAKMARTDDRDRNQPVSTVALDGRKRLRDMCRGVTGSRRRFLLRAKDEAAAMAEASNVSAFPIVRM